MKKIMVILAALLTVATAVFAQSVSGSAVEQKDSYADRTTQTIEVEDKYAELHPSAKVVKLTLEYTPYTNDVRFYYDCLATSYDQGEAMNTALAIFQDFAREHGYKHYRYAGKDRTKYYKDQDAGSNIKVRKATYSSYVIFSE